MLIIYFFQMVLNTCEMWSNGIKIAFFSKKFQKIAQRLGALSQDPRLWYVWINWFTYTSLPLYIFSFTTFGLSPLPLENSLLCAKPGHGFWSSILRYLCLTKIPLSKISDDFIAFDFWFAPPIKNPGYAYARGMAFRAVSPKSLLELPKRE